MILNSKSIKDTQNFAIQLVSTIGRRRIMALVGDLGSGKTTFAQYILQALGVTEKITSPTFLIIKPYTLNAKPYTRAYHIDCYRLHDPQELLALGFEKIINDPLAFVIIEWADKIRLLLPPTETLWLMFEHGVTSSDRIITIESE